MLPGLPGKGHEKQGTGEEAKAAAKQGMKCPDLADRKAFTYAPLQGRFLLWSINTRFPRFSGAKAGQVKGAQGTVLLLIIRGLAYILSRGDGVDKVATTIDYNAAMRDFEIELMLLVNERLHQKGEITTEMYIKAKEMILKA